MSLAGDEIDSPDCQTPDKEHCMWYEAHRESTEYLVPTHCGRGDSNGCFCVHNIYSMLGLPSPRQGSLVFSFRNPFDDMLESIQSTGPPYKEYMRSRPHQARLTQCGIPSGRVYPRLLSSEQRRVSTPQTFRYLLIVRHQRGRRHHHDGSQLSHREQTFMTGQPTSAHRRAGRCCIASWLSKTNKPNIRTRGGVVHRGVGGSRGGID